MPKQMTRDEALAKLNKVSREFNRNPDSKKLIKALQTATREFKEAEAREG